VQSTSLDYFYGLFVNFMRTFKFSSDSTVSTVDDQIHPTPLNASVSLTAVCISFLQNTARETFKDRTVKSAKTSHRTSGENTEDYDNKSKDKSVTVKKLCS